MDALSAPLVLTKMRVPALRTHLVARTRLMALLAAEKEPGLILVCAPAGYGKTTLLAAWARSLQHNGAAVAWYAIDPSDDDPIPFGSYLVASFIHSLDQDPIPELAQVAQQLRASPETDLQKILPSLINAVTSSSRPCWLILDDYHLLNSPAIHSAIRYLLEHRPENLRIAIGSRTNPPLPLARLRARGELLEVRAANLRFKQDETAQFLNEIMRLELSPEAVVALGERTEGWIAGLQLAALALQTPLARQDILTPDKLPPLSEKILPFSGSHRYQVEYFMEEVINRLPEEVQWFLLSTSILERMCAPLGDAVLDDSQAPGKNFHSAVVLSQLEQANLFVFALDDQGIWYRYHHLFRDFLFTQLKKVMPERVSALHRAACKWLAANQFLREAARHAFATRDWNDAAAFVEQHSFTLIVQSEIATLYEWCAAFPEEVIQKRPMLCILQCWAWVFTFRKHNRERVEKRLQQAEWAIARMEDQQVARELTAHVEVVRTFLVMAPDPNADPHAHLSHAHTMLNAHSEAEAGQLSALISIAYAQMALYDVQAAEKTLQTAREVALGGRLYSGIIETTFHLACLAHKQGQLQRAVMICQQGQADMAAILPDTMPAQPKLPALGSLEIALGCVLLEQDHLEAAEQHLLSGLNQMSWGMNPYYLMTAYTALFRLRQFQGRPKEALEFLSRLEAAWPDIAFCTRGLRVVHALRAAPEDPTALADAAAWCQNFSPRNDAPPGIGPFGAAEAYYQASLAWIRAQIAIGNPQVARLHLGLLLEMSVTHGLTTRLIELSLLEAELLAMSSQAADNQQRAFVALKRALSLAKPEGYLRIFDQGPALARLLMEAKKQGIEREYIEQILAVTRVRKETDPASKGDTAGSQMASKDPAHPSPPPDLALTEPLSERELEVLYLIARGSTNQAIAEQLVITVGTVKSHINHILGKLGAHNRTEAVARARELGWI